MRNNQSLLGSDGNNALLALLTVDTPVVSTEEEVLLALDVETRSLELRRIIKALDKLGNLGGGDVEGGRLGPNRVTSAGVKSSLANAGVGQSINVG